MAGELAGKGNYYKVNATGNVIYRISFSTIAKGASAILYCEGSGQLPNAYFLCVDHDGKSIYPVALGGQTSHIKLYVPSSGVRYYAYLFCGLAYHGLGVDFLSRYPHDNTVVVENVTDSVDLSTMTEIV